MISRLRSADILKKPDPGPWEEDYTRRGALWSGAIHDLPDLPPGSRIMELGCGNGKTAIPMILQGWEVIALDFSPRAVAFCRKAIPDFLHGQVMIADARWSPFKSATFDAILAIHVIAHMYAPDRNCVAREITRLLRPEGVLFFCEFSSDDFRFGKGHETEEATFRRGTGIITHYFSEKEVSDLFSGLTPVSITKHPWLMRVRGCSLVRSEVHGIFTR